MCGRVIETENRQLIEIVGGPDWCPDSVVVQQQILALVVVEGIVVLHRIAGHLGLDSSEALDRDFGASVPHWPAFPDSADALRALKEHYKLVILSNVNRNGFAASNAKLGVEFDAIYTAEDVGAYKPATANFEYLLAHLKSDLGLERVAPVRELDQPGVGDARVVPRGERGQCPERDQEREPTAGRARHSSSTSTR